MFRFCLSQGQQDKYRYDVAQQDERDKKKKKGQKKDMDELKQELTMDEHKIPIAELYSRLNSDPTTVSSLLLNINLPSQMYRNTQLRANNCYSSLLLIAYNFHIKIQLAANHSM